jgi:asparagine synthase (glutamine-hydrolysing)
MCGIAGISAIGQLDEQALHKLQTALSHRGPDGHGQYIHKAVGLVHTRLSIIDLATGDQPLLGPGPQALIANGEIYNNAELRAQTLDYPYKTHSDCEPILALWKKHQMDTPQYLRGMYAFALYDESTKALYLSRDPFGIKPLYYIQTATGIAFASEPAALIKAGLSTAKVRAQSLSELMQLRFTTGEFTIFEGIKRVMPGETLKIVAGEIVESRRWRPLALTTQVDETTRSSTSLEDLHEVLLDSVKAHLQSDVPYGLFLSGGIDSSIVLSLMARICPPEKLRTYSIGFPGTFQHDERSLASKMAISVQARHTNVDFTEEDFWRLLPQVAKALDDPVIDYAALPTFKLAQVAAKDVKVVLCGEGGDESFAGYRRYQRARRPRILGGRLWRGKGLMTPVANLSLDLTGWDSFLKMTENQVKEQRWSRVQMAQYIDFQHWLPDDLLTKLDRCLMAWGVEGRTPFVDRIVSPYGFHLPDGQKVSLTEGKLILRRYLEKYFPVAEPFAKKRGFNVPVEQWLTTRCKQIARWLVAQAGAREIMSESAIHALFMGLKKDKSLGLPAWALLFYAVWHRIHVEGRPVTGDQILGYVQDEA